MGSDRSRSLIEGVYTYRSLIEALYTLKFPPVVSFNLGTSNLSCSASLRRKVGGCADRLALMFKRHVDGVWDNSYKVPHVGIP